MTIQDNDTRTEIPEDDCGDDDDCGMPIVLVVCISMPFVCLVVTALCIFISRVILP